MRSPPAVERPEREVRRRALARGLSTGSEAHRWQPSRLDENIAWTRATHAALRPHLQEARWLNYLGDDQDGDAVRAAYGPNYDRLLAVKRRVDPQNVFHHNHNINPG
jgi:FAD/FMN-containing dehydrogenase